MSRRAGAIRGPSRVLAAAALLTALAAPAVAQKGAALEQRVDRLAEQVRQAEAIRAIKRLQAAYGHYAEFGLWNDFAELFADQGVGHYAQGPMVGRDAIRKLFFEQVGQGRLGLADGRIYPHIVFQPVVTLDPGGLTARGRWHVLALLGGYGGNATWVGGVYENRYVFENGAWKIAELTYATQFTAPYDRGWTAPRAPATSAPPSDSCDDYFRDCTFALHFDPRRAGTPSPPAVVEQRAGAPPADAAALAARVTDLERRAARLGDEAAVTNLQHAYGYYVDRKRWDDVADLFADDATLELGNQGVYAGKPSIRRALEQFGPPGLKRGELNDHLELQTLVTVAPDGASAQARGVELVQWGGMRDGAYRAEWRESIFENRYVNEQGVWKIAAMRLYPRFITDYAQGWAKSAEPVPPPSKDFPPDRPPTAVYAVYPKFSIPPLHFANPATGAPPQYPDDARPAAAPASAPPSARAANDPWRGPRTGSLDDRLAAAERAAAVAVAYDAAENLLNAHSYYLDEMRWDDVADLFAANGSDEVGQLGVYAGRERIRAALRTLYPRDGRPAGVLAIHQTTQPVIDVAPDGASAKIRERVLQVGGRLGAEGEWRAGVYEGEAVLEDGVWKLAALDLDYTWAAPYRGGWAAVAAGAEFDPDPGVGSDPGVGAVARAGQPPAFTRPSGLSPPDLALRGPVRPPFPEILRLQFHYPNPVTGRPAGR